jgi:hypothetical protein
MKAVAVILIIIAVISAVGAAGDFIDAMQKRADQVRFMSIGNVDSSIREINHYDDAEHQDALIFLFACGVIAASLILTQSVNQREMEHHNPDLGSRKVSATR